MTKENVYPRLDPEWLTLNAVRDLIKLAVQGDSSKSTYKSALDLGAVICPEILGPDVSILQQDRESDLTKEYRQRATYRSIRENESISPLSLVIQDIEEFESLLTTANVSNDKTKTDKLKRKLLRLRSSEEELNPDKSSENQLIFRDAYKIDRGFPVLTETNNSRTYELYGEDLLTIRVLHPEKAEHITGADLVYERFDEVTKKVVIAFVQYKIWESRKMSLSDPRMQEQIKRMKGFLCDKDICKNRGEIRQYRFPCCSAFLRPTDKLQSPNQAFISTGEHLPICYLNECESTSLRGARVLEYENIRNISLSHEMFEELFSQGKIGSKPLSLEELAILYEDSSIISKKDRVLLYAQEYPK